jgi:hypothetical protein
MVSFRSASGAFKAWILTKAAHDQEQAAKQDHLEDSR